MNDHITFACIFISMSALIFILVIGELPAIAFSSTTSDNNLDKGNNNNNNNNKTIVQETKEDVIAQANSFLTKRPASVMDKSQLPASGNKHDFLELGPHCWPDPKSTNGLPYVCGQERVNPEFYSIPDYRNMLQMIKRTEILSLAYHLTSNESYSSKATELLRVWFLNNDTKMNPNMQFSEFIPGLNNGSRHGIITAHRFTDIIDAIRLIDSSPSWTKQDQQGMNVWFSEYLDWLLTSNLGIQEGESRNNHGTYYHVQVAAISLYLNKTDITKTALLKVMEERIPLQIRENGSQPLELQRHKSLDYSFFNLLGLFKLAKIGDSVGIDLWNFKTSEGSGLQKGLDYLLPFLRNNATSPYFQKSPTEWGKVSAAALLREASVHYPENQIYLQIYNSLEKEIIIADTERILEAKTTGT